MITKLGIRVDSLPVNNFNPFSQLYRVIPFTDGKVNSKGPFQNDNSLYKVAWEIKNVQCCSFSIVSAAVVENVIGC